MKYLFKSIIGVFLIDDKGVILDQSFDFEDGFLEKYKGVGFLPEDKLEIGLLALNKKEFYGRFYDQNLKFTKKDVKKSVSFDVLIMQVVNIIMDIDKTVGALFNRFLGFGMLTIPEFVNLHENKEGALKKVCELSREELLKIGGVSESESMGADLGEDYDYLKKFAFRIYDLIQLKKENRAYLRKLMIGACPNVLEVCGDLLGAKIINLAGGLYKLSRMPSSAIQVLGAEKALFRHLKKGAKNPKHGILHEHPALVGCGERGKAARLIASKISIASKLDFFKGEFKGVELRSDIEKVYGKWKVEDE